ncbi:MAG: leucine-rich repeat protein [Paludibacteraceae bacterium]|nr:leucine-rich repeat protein [Paludibacteraceae bacterium]
MKKFLLFMTFCYSVGFAWSQSSVPNNGFEDWTDITFMYPSNYAANSNLDNDTKYPVTRTEGYTGNYAVRLESVFDRKLELTYFMNARTESDNPNEWHGGMPYTEIPTGIQGFYKYNRDAGDSGTMIVAFSKNGVNIGSYYYSFIGLHEEFVPFNCAFEPVLTESPDSVIVAFASGSMMGTLEGSVLVVDNISFDGVTAQPVWLNGDFENWEEVIREQPDAWYVDNGNRDGIATKSTDAYRGTYAIELKTLWSERNDEMKMGSVMSGFYPQCPEGEDCKPICGQPYQQQTDVLEFYYKYSPSGVDRASVGLFFKTTGGFGDWQAGLMLEPASEFTLAEVPFNLGFVPDSVIIQFQSSEWNTLSEANIGSTLVIDNVWFRSQKGSLSKTVACTPGQLSTLMTSEELEMTNLLTVTGSIDARDFKTMRDAMPDLTSVDLSNVVVEAYVGDEGTAGTALTAYPVNTIPRNAFLAKSLLTSVVMPSGITAIGRSAFNRCQKLNNVVVPSSVTVIDTLAFRSCTGLADISIPSSVTDLKMGAFQQCGVNGFNFAEGLQRIDVNVFQGCPNLTYVFLPASVEQIGNYAFLFTNRLQTINVAGANMHFSSSDGVLFDKDMQRLLHYPALKGEYCAVPDGVTTIDDAAFYGHWRLRHVRLPSTLTTINYAAFSGCNMLNAIEIPSSVSNIGNSAFYGTNALSAVFVQNATPINMLVADSVFRKINAGCTLYVPAGSESAYQSSDGWSHYFSRIKGYEVVTDVEGNKYHAISIGTQKWMVENLRTQHYNNTDEIATTDQFMSVCGMMGGQYSWPVENNENNSTLFGRVYSWNAANDVRGICPDGWRIPTRADWETLFGYVDSSFSETVPKSLVAPAGWTTEPAVPGTPSNSQWLNNESGFLAFPAGDRPCNGGFSGHWGVASFWTTDYMNEYVSYAYHIDYNMTYVNAGLYANQEGYSIRCIKDDVGTDNCRNQISGLQLYPNVVETGFYIKGNASEYKVRICNMIGLEILCINNASDFVSISELPAGIYMVYVSGGNETLKTKLLKK